MVEKGVQQEKILFVATCYAKNFSFDVWLVDSSCSHNMTYDVGLLIELKKSYTSKVKVEMESMYKSKAKV